jgi:hypothetical protein
MCDVTCGTRAYCLVMTPWNNIIYNAKVASVQFTELRGAITVTGTFLHVYLTYVFISLSRSNLRK